MTKRVLRKTVGPAQRVGVPSHKNFIDIFAGCGGLSLGLMQAGWQGLFAVEHEENAFETLRHNLIERVTHPHFNWPSWLPKSHFDIMDFIHVYREQLDHLSGKVELLVGGPPCQGFSTAGRRDPTDPRNKLVEAYLEFVNLVNPRMVLIENVRGITADFVDQSSLSGKVNYADWLISALSERYVVWFKTLDLSTFGVPQKRHRFLVIAVRKDAACVVGENPFDVIENYRTAFLRRKGIPSLPVSAKSAICDLETAFAGTLDSCDSVGFQQIGYKGPVTAYQKLMNAGVGESVSDTRLARHRAEIVTRFSRIIDHCHATGRLSISLAPEVRASFGLRKCAIRVLDPEKPSPTVTSMPDDLIHYSEPRTLTVRENARLQGFPDWFAFKGKYTTGGDRRRKEVPRFTQVANAVPPLAAEAIGQALLIYLQRLDSFQNSQVSAEDFEKNPENLLAQL